MEPTTKLAIGIDIGGTKVAGGLVDACGEIHVRSRTPMITTGEASKGLAAVSAAIEALFPDAAERPRIEAIGICAPGPLNPLTGMILNPPNLAIWHNYPLAEEMRRLYNVNVRIDNDANAAALAEAKWGAGRGYRNVFYASIGTGIGTGIVFDGRIYHGRTGIGRRGGQKLSKYPKSLLGELASGNANAVTSELVAKAYAARDPAAEEVIQETLDLLAYWLGSIIDLLEPEVIVVGGGVSTMLAPFLNEIRERWRGACLNPAPMEIPLVLARYGEDAGIVGAAALCEFE